MSEKQYFDFLISWQKIIFILIFVALGLAVLNRILYRMRLASKKTLKEKFDLVSEKGVKSLFKGHTFVALAIFFLINITYCETVQIKSVWFFIRFFISFCIGFLYAYVAHLVLKYHYPGRLEKKLRILRYTPRINPTNGNKMTLLKENEEDVYLDKGMQAEEKVFSVDYDVWKDPTTGYTQIEKYKGNSSILKCDRCDFQTLRLEKEEIIEEVTDTEDGKLLREYVCSYCHRIKRKTFNLSINVKKSETSSIDGDSSTPESENTTQDSDQE